MIAILGDKCAINTNCIGIIEGKPGGGGRVYFRKPDAGYTDIDETEMKTLLLWIEALYGRNPPKSISITL